ncbi:MAG: nucleoside triphosphate pyrophosphohydrolase [Rhodospirillales bacterium]|nr:nucleoside triphosphate pyrophosphohydrolase [Rhodospirillales bacterium]
MNAPDDDAGAELLRLRAVMAALRDPATGCPWDKEQDFASIAPYTIEEAYEVADAIARDDMPALADELGDLLFQVVYHARLAEERGAFAFADVARAIADKMIRRHPHVFAPRDDTGAPAFPPGTWEAQKSAERAARAEHATLAGIAVALPALSRAAKLTARAARVGFDWPDAEAVLEKLHEEIGELRAELPRDGRPANAARLADEMGDLLFVLANLARKLGLDAETCLHQANRKFERRFNAVEARLLQRATTPAEAGLAAMEEEWIAVKKTEQPG